MISILIGIILLVLSFVITKKKYNFLISGWNNLNNDEQEKYGNFIIKDTSLLIKIVSFLLICLGSIEYTKTILKVSSHLKYYFCILFFLIIIITFFFKKKKYKNYHRYIALFFLLITIIFSIFFFKSIKEPNLILNNSTKSLKIDCLYGIDDLNYKSIISVKLVSSNIKIINKINGFSMDNFYKGYFILTDGKPAYIFLNQQNDKCIAISTSSHGLIYLNYNSKEKTSENFQKIREALK
jgi:hypothetical protein